MLFDEMTCDVGPYHEMDDSNITQESDYLLPQEDSTFAIANFHEDDPYSSYCYHLQDKPWTKEEDENLLSLVHQFGGEKWPEICHLLNRRDERDCERRYQYCKSLLKGFNYWSEEEENLLRLLIQKFEGKKPNWRVISNHIPTRTIGAIKTHWRAMRQRENLQNQQFSIDFPKSHLLSTAQQEGHQYFGLDCESKPICLETTDIILSHSDDSQTTYNPNEDSRLEFGSNTLSYEELEYSARCHKIKESQIKGVMCDENHRWRNFTEGSIAPRAPSLTICSSTSSSREITPANSFYWNSTSTSDPCDPLETSNSIATTGIHDGIKTLVRHNSISSATSCDSCPTSNEVNEEELVSSFIETFGCMDDEETRLGPPQATSMELKPNTAALDSNGELYAFNKIIQEPKRIVSSWENAKNSLPLRFQNRRSKKRCNRERQPLGERAPLDRRKKKKVQNQRKSADTQSCENKPMTTAALKSKAILDIDTLSKSSSMEQKLPIENAFDLKTVPVFPQPCQNSVVEANGFSISPTYHAIQAPNMLVYLPCIYTSTPNQTMVYSPNHPSMQGLPRPPPGFRLIQAPALISSEWLPQSTQNSDVSTDGNNFSSTMSSATGCAVKIPTEDGQDEGSRNHPNFD